MVIAKGYGWRKDLSSVGVTNVEIGAAIRKTSMFELYAFYGTYLRDIFKNLCSEQGSDRRNGMQTIAAPA
jgi:hypothetical protein